MAKNSTCCCSDNLVVVLPIVVGVAYVLQHNGVLFGNVILWPWVLVAVGVIMYLFNKH